MLPANNRGAGGNIAAPDLCATPPVGAPVPYVNIALNAMAMPFAVKTFLSFVNALNQGSVVPMTLGDQAGVMSPFMGPGMCTVGNMKIMMEMLPATNLMSQAAGNGMVAPLGATLMPSVTNVFYTCKNELQNGWLQKLAQSLSTDALSARLPGNAIYLKVPIISVGLPGQAHDVLQRQYPNANLLVLDLRGCPGGELMPAIQLAGDFLPAGAEVVTMLDADGDETIYRSTSENPDTTPLLILVDRHTASAAEVLAGALQAHQRAVVVGEPTYGKGSTQVILPSATTGASYANVGSVRLPFGRALSGVGIQPDVCVE